MKLIKLMLWAMNFAVDTVILFIMVGFVLPFCIVCWCFYHPALFRLYASNAWSLLAYTNNASRAVLAVIILLAMLCFKLTRPFANITLRLGIVVGIGMYIIACF